MAAIAQRHLRTALLLFAGFGCLLPGVAAADASPADGGVIGHVQAQTASVAFQINAQHDGHIDDPLFTALPSLQWSKTFDEEVQYPLIAEGKVFVDVGNRNKRGYYGTEVSAFELDSGARIWGPVNIRGGPFGALTYDDGRVFALTHKGDLYALDAASGVELWSKRRSQHSWAEEAPTAYRGRVYATGTGSGGDLYSVTAKKGRLEWRVGLSAFGGDGLPAVSRHGVFVATGCDEASSFSLSGATQWHHDTGCDGGYGSTSVLHDGLVYLRDNSGDRAPVTLSQQTGEVTGEYSSDVTATPALSGGTMVTVTNGTLTAVALATSETLWTNNAYPFTLSPIIVNDVVFQTDSTGIVHGFGILDGTELWSGYAGAPIPQYSYYGPKGLAAAAGHLVVPATNTLAVFTATG